ncbi:MAG TPA: hypothetical protein VE907_12565 [Gammaproteobacteria bacterium]|nr:hypothetical protein [Gammaproteobacteria bacterium]
MATAFTFDREPDVDQLVAAYSALGRRRRARRRRKRHLAAALLVGLLLAMAAWVWLVWPAFATFGSRDTAALEQLRNGVAAALAELGAARSELAAERTWQASASRELEVRLRAVEERYASFESRQTELGAQSARLADGLAKLDSERALLLAAHERGASSERALSQIAGERRALEERRQKSAAEDLHLRDQLDSLGQERRSLESQHDLIDAKRRASDAELEQRGTGPAPAPDPTSALFEPGNVPLAAVAIDAARLGDMRGGVLLGGGVNVAIGLTRSVTLNGEQQYASTLRIDDLGAAVDPAALANVGQLLIQNGPGNSVSNGFLDSWTGFGTIVQNSLDGQHIDATTVLDISIQNVATAIDGLAASRAVSDALTFQQ